ncbi:hypothetical protein HY489_03735 [Candidatus Woesearchaeota archaeon]|nr:hypothetical protein [Candidatus Woesearchaeota archaeon]
MSLSPEEFIASIEKQSHAFQHHRGVYSFELHVSKNPLNWGVEHDLTLAHRNRRSIRNKPLPIIHLGTLLFTRITAIDRVYHDSLSCKEEAVRKAMRTLAGRIREYEDKATRTYRGDDHLVVVSGLSYFRDLRQNGQPILAHEVYRTKDPHVREIREALERAH